MTFREAFEQCVAIAAEHDGESFCLEVHAWKGQAGPKWSVWSTTIGIHFRGHDAETAVEKYRAVWKEAPIQGDPTGTVGERLDAIGDEGVSL